MKFAILKNEFDDNHEYWINACRKLGQDYQVIDMTLSSWLEEIEQYTVDGYLACPSGRESMYKTMYDEKIFILEKTLNKFVFPCYNEICLHENKRYLSYWLKANNLPHPKTRVYYDYKEAKIASQELPLPLVGKFNIGASGKGVVIFHNRPSLVQYIENAFGNGLRQEWGPNFKMGGYLKRILNLIKNPELIWKKLAIYHKMYNEIQKGFIILQEYIAHDFEWRVVRIGNSYFGHQKIKQGDKASGTKGINYVTPPEKLLDFVKSVCTKYSFTCMAIDLFEDGQGGYLINEMQCIFGHVQAYICEKDGQPGRFVMKNNQWIFESGMYNTNLSYDLRLEHVLSMLGKKS
jgi:glutathione synthase/RimK-type ligase-like ATP-grasp enzyme